MAAGPARDRDLARRTGRALRPGRRGCGRRCAHLDAVALDGGTDAWRAAGAALVPGAERLSTPITDVYKRPYEGTDNATGAMQAYLEWEYGLVAQLARDGTHGFFVI